MWQGRSTTIHSNGLHLLATLKICFLATACCSPSYFTPSASPATPASGPEAGFASLSSFFLSLQSALRGYYLSFPLYLKKKKESQNPHCNTNEKRTDEKETFAVRFFPALEVPPVVRRRKRHPRPCGGEEGKKKKKKK
eukprot:Sspe_Gene.14617::Locus_5062_Transcript_1_1_Confidence_1.000_Length_2969::g.14617::m.14617